MNGAYLRQAHFVKAPVPGDGPQGSLLGMAVVPQSSRASSPCRLSLNTAQEQWTAIFENLHCRHSTPVLDFNSLLTACLSE
jgi:hypothetical protein